MPTACSVTAVTEAEAILARQNSGSVVGASVSSAATSSAVGRQTRVSVQRANSAVRKNGIRVRRVAGIGANVGKPAL